MKENKKKHSKVLSFMIKLWNYLKENILGIKSPSKECLKFYDLILKEEIPLFIFYFEDVLNKLNAEKIKSITRGRGC